MALPSSVDSIGSCSSSARMEQYVPPSLLLFSQADLPSPQLLNLASSRRIKRDGHGFRGGGDSETRCVEGLSTLNRIASSSKPLRSESDFPPRPPRRTPLLHLRPSLPLPPSRHPRRRSRTRRPPLAHLRQQAHLQHRQTPLLSTPHHLLRSVRLRRRPRLPTETPRDAPIHHVRRTRRERRHPSSAGVGVVVSQKR